MENVECAPMEGALYAFPTIKMPEKAMEAAKAQNMAADSMYCSELLDATGIVIVPGTGFHRVQVLSTFAHHLTAGDHGQFSPCSRSFTPIS